MKNLTAFASPSSRKRSRSDSDILATAPNNSPNVLFPIKRFKVDTPPLPVKIQTFTPYDEQQKNPVFALPIKRFHGYMPVVEKTQTSIPATVQQKRTTAPLTTVTEVQMSTVNTVFADIVQHHLKNRTLVTPRDVLLFLATDDRFRLLPKLLHMLDSMLDRIERIYRTNLSAGVSLLLPGTKTRIKVTPSVATKLVTLYKLLRRTDQCLRAYVRRSINTSSRPKSSSPKSSSEINNSENSTSIDKSSQYVGLKKLN